MRPKKQILLVDGDENRRSVRRFVLETRGFAVEAVATAEEPIAKLCQRRLPFELVIVAWPINAGATAALLIALRKMNWHCSSLLLAETLAKGPDDSFFDGWLLGAFTTEGLIDQVKLMTARKRGPRKMAIAPARNVMAGVAAVA
jgi:CheY-like chemotaxis protein